MIDCKKTNDIIMLKEAYARQQLSGEHSLARAECIPNTELRQGDFKDTTNGTVFY